MPVFLVPDQIPIRIKDPPPKPPMGEECMSIKPGCSTLAIQEFGTVFPPQLDQEVLLNEK